MSTSPDTIIFLSDQLTELGTRVRTRKMFGEYAIYCDDKVVGLICDDQLFIKITPEGKHFMGTNYQEALPYVGAKPYMLIGGDIIDNKDAFVELITTTASILPIAKPKRVKVK